MNSMTGYGRGESAIDGLRCVVECASVNRKGIEVACQLPREFAARETSVREIVVARVARGRVNVAVTLGATDSSAIVEFDRRLARGLLADLRAVKAELDLAGEVDLNTLLSIPGVFRTPERSTAEMWPAVSRALEEALAALLVMRAREGRNLQRDLRKRLALLRKWRGQMSRLASGVAKRYRDQLVSRLAQSGVQLPLDDPRLLTEIAMFAERCDVSEELTRLDSHFEQFSQKLDSSEPIGRALEFLTQEIYRELNTLGSKAGDSALTQLVVDSKVELDRIREQILNVE